MLYQFKFDLTMQLMLNEKFKYYTIHPEGNMNVCF